MQPTTNKIDNNKLNSDAEELLLCMPEHVSELVHELSSDYFTQVWQIFCGVVLEVYMQGRLSNYTLDPAWADGLKQYDYRCKHCKKSFKPTNLGQVYCSNDCGVADTQEVVPNARISKPSKQPDPVPVVTEPLSTDDFNTRLSEVAKNLSKGDTGSGWSAEPVPMD